MKKHKPLTGQHNQCAGCGELFNSNVAFDKHRTGEYGKDRHCRTTEEMLGMGMAKNSSGWWVTALYLMPFTTPIASLESTQEGPVVGW